MGSHLTASETRVVMKNSNPEKLLMLDFEYLTDFLLANVSGEFIKTLVEIKTIKNEFKLSTTLAKAVYHGWKRADKLQVKGKIRLDSYMKGYCFAIYMRKEDKATNFGFRAGML